MTTSPVNSSHPRRAAGFTIVELMIAATLGSIVLAGVITSFLMLVRSGTRLENYSMMETQTRRAFEQMGIDVRMASNFIANFTGSDVTSFTLTIPTNDLSTTYNVTYGYYTATDGTLTFYRMPGATAATGTTTDVGRQDLITKMTSLTIIRYDSSYTPITGVDSSTIKHIQLSVNVSRAGMGVAASTQYIRSSAFTIRNMSL